MIGILKIILLSLLAFMAVGIAWVSSDRLVADTLLHDIRYIAALAVIFAVLTGLERLYTRLKL